MHGLEFNPGDDMLSASVSKAPTVNGRIHAAETLAKRGSLKTVNAIRDAYQAEAHWGVRIAFARALGAGKSEHAARALCELLGAESDVRVMQTLVTQLGRYRTQRLLKL